MSQVSADTSRQVSIGEAAIALGISVQAVRRRIRSGELRAERVQRPQGYSYLIDLSTPVDTFQVPAPTGTSHVSTPVAAIDRHVPARDGLAIALAADLRMAHERIKTLEQERFELAGRLGYFQGQLEEARQRIHLLEAPKAEPSLSTVDSEPRRPWWRRLFGD